MRTRTRHNKAEFRRWSWRRISLFASGWSSGSRGSGVGDKSSATTVNPGHHGFGSEVIRNDHPVCPSKAAIRFRRAARRRFGLTPQAMDNTDAHVVKIRATWSPQNVYVIDGKSLNLDGFVKRRLAEAAGKCSRALESGRRRTPPNGGGCCDFFFSIFPRKKSARVALPTDDINPPKGTQYGNDKETLPVTLSPHRAPPL
jgi:hypothetical protein